MSNTCVWKAHGHQDWQPARYTQLVWNLYTKVVLWIYLTKCISRVNLEDKHLLFRSRDTHKACRAFFGCTAIYDWQAAMDIKVVWICFTRCTSQVDLKDKNKNFFGQGICAELYVDLFFHRKCTRWQLWFRLVNYSQPRHPSWGIQLPWN